MNKSTYLVAVVYLAVLSNLAIADDRIDPVRTSFSLDEFDYRWQDGDDPLAWSVSASVGTKRHKMWLISEADRTRGQLGSSEVRLYYSHQMRLGWNVVLGWRGDTKPEPDQNWLLVGAEGSLPRNVDTTITLYGGEGRETALRLELEREFGITPALSLTPQIKIDWYGQENAARGLGSGLSTVETAMRLSYSWTHSFTPYLGIIWVGSFGNTADLIRAEGDSVNVTQALIGFSYSF